MSFFIIGCNPYIVGIHYIEKSLAGLNELLAAGQSNPDSGYGIFNVNERIKLYYGMEYGLMLESAQNEWTRATLVFPAQIVEEEEEL